MIQNLSYSNTSIKHNKSLFYYIALIVILIMYFIFFNANSILPDNSTVMNSALGKEVNAGSTKLSINKWEYNKNKGFMEVELSYKDSGDYITTKLNFSAKAKVNVKEKLNVKTILNTDNIYIVRIENIPKNYEAIALKVSQNSSANTTSTIDTNDISTDDFSSSTANDSDNTGTITNNSTTLYCDYRKVKINNNIKDEEQKYYIINITKSKISNINKDINTVNNSIKTNDNLTDMANDKINTLNSQYKYEITQEQTNTDQQINTYKAKIVENERQNSTLEITKSSLLEKINKLNEKINDIKQSEVKADIKTKTDTKIKTDNADIKVNNTLFMLQSKREKQQENFNHIESNHNKEMKKYIYKYELFIEGKKERKPIKKPKVIKKVAKKTSKKVVKKVVKKAPKKAVKKVSKK